jgi:hypothetical protein
LSLKTKVNGFLQFGLKTGDDKFSDLGLKPGNSGLMIWVSKSPRRFLGLCFKTKKALVCRLRHKTDGARTTCRDPAACFAWKQVALGFLSLTSRLTKMRRRVVHVAPSRRLHWDQVEDGRVDAMDCVRSGYPYFAVFYILDPRDILVF